MQSIDVTWTSTDFLNLDYQFREAKDDAQFNDYQFEPYLSVMKIGCFHCGADAPSWIQCIGDQFDLHDKVLAIHYMQPGCLLPLHRDQYQFYSKKYAIEDINKIKRILVFLEQSQPGHIIQIENQFYTDWQAGQCVQWTGDTLHAAYNLGTKKRFILQITGHQE